MLVLFHDVTDPSSAVAVARCTRLATEGLPISFEGFEAVGLDVTIGVTLDVAARLASVQQAAEAEDLTLRRPTAMPPTGPAHVLLAHTEETEQAAAVRMALYRAYWEAGADIASTEVLIRIATRCGVPETTVRPLLEDRVALASRRRRMAGHRRDGIGGVPVLLASRTLIPGLLAEREIRDLAAAV